MKQTKLQLEAYILSLLLIERLDEIKDESKRGIKYFSKKLIHEIEGNDKDLSKTTSDVGSLLSEGLENMLDSLMKQVYKTKI
tara:strand:+ start:2467 stop:2712 length:246 start_codon:yes stop_codon:yes gene_type:complete